MKEIATATVRLYPSTRKKYKVLAAKKNTTIAEIAKNLVDAPLK